MPVSSAFVPRVQSLAMRTGHSQPASNSNAPRAGAADWQDPLLPAWVSRLIGVATRPAVVRSGPDSVCLVRAGDHVLLTVRLEAAVRDAPLVLQRRTLEAYRTIAGILRTERACHPVRFWNFVPHIGAAMGDGLDRYMVFNAGRFAAFLEWFGGEADLDQGVATSTGVGHDGDDLIIHALASERPGVHVMNPRQRQPRCYSAQYGPFPPCFARATVLPRPSGGWHVLVGGTAAVYGEQSVCPGDLAGQVQETFRNLDAVIESAAQVAHGRGAAADTVRCFRTLRVYHPRPEDEAPLRRMLAARYGQVPDLTFVRADICRPELLVEIEGTSELDGVRP